MLLEVSCAMSMVLLQFGHIRAMGVIVVLLIGRLPRLGLCPGLFLVGGVVPLLLHKDLLRLIIIIQQRLTRVVVLSASVVPLNTKLLRLRVTFGGLMPLRLLRGLVQMGLLI